jgi:hypothetical protein
LYLSEKGPVSAGPLLIADAVPRIAAAK